MRTYTRPDIQAPRVRPQQQSNELTPETDVTVIFRGGPPIHDMWDSREYTVPPVPEGVTLEEWRATFQPASFWTLQYGVAQHLQSRAIVPGTRNPHDFKRAMSQLGIVGIDREDRCTPFTAELMKKFKWPEGIDRSQFLDGRRNVQYLDTAQAIAEASVDIEQALEAQPDLDALTPPADHDGLREVREAEREAGPAGQNASRTRRGRTRFDDER